VVRIDRSLCVAQAPEVLFHLLCDPLRFPRLFKAFSKVEQISADARCVGARYLMLVRVGRSEAGGVQRITDFQPPYRIAWTSERGVELSAAVSIRPVGSGVSEVRVELAYAVPGWRPAGVIVERLTRHVVDRHMHATLLTLKRLAEFDLETVADTERQRP